MKLIREQVQDIQYLTEEKDGQKHRYITGIFMQAEQKNRNGRVYPFPVLNREVQRYNTEYVQKNRALGELGHPDNPSINLDRVSHMITSLKPDGNNFIGKARIVDTQMGRTVAGLLDAGVSLGVSTRGVGSLKPHNGYQLVQDDFKLATAADIVADPSAPEAFVQGIMEEVDWVWENGMWKQQSLEFAKKQIQSASKHDLEAVALRIFENFVSKI
jgi:hypothetical protein